MTPQTPSHGDLASRLDKALSRLRGECQRLEAGEDEGLDAAVTELEEIVATLARTVSGDEANRRLITNAICEMQAARGHLAAQLEEAANGLRAAQGQRRAISAYAKAGQR